MKTELTPEEKLEIVIFALQDLGEAECCKLEYPQQYNDGNCHHCKAVNALRKIGVKPRYEDM